MSFRPSSRPPEQPEGPRKTPQDSTPPAGHDAEADPFADLDRDPLEDPPDTSQTDPNEYVTNLEAADYAGPETGLEEGDESAQRFAEDRVKEDMATAAVRPQSHVGPLSGEVRTPSSGATLAPEAWSQLSDAEIMLRVAAGAEAGFSLLVEKYRRQMVHYMYRMVHNQAVAEELAQEVFLRVYRARANQRQRYGHHCGDLDQTQHAGR